MKRNKRDPEFNRHNDERNDRIQAVRDRKERDMERRDRRKQQIIDKHGACEYTEVQMGRREYGR